MEDTLREDETLWEEEIDTCLNPCFNGRYSQRCLVSCANNKEGQS